MFCFFYFLLCYFKILFIKLQLQTVVKRKSCSSDMIPRHENVTRWLLILHSLRNWRCLPYSWFHQRNALTSVHNLPDGLLSVRYSSEGIHCSLIKSRGVLQPFLSFCRACCKLPLEFVGISGRTSEKTGGL